MASKARRRTSSGALPGWRELAEGNASRQRPRQESPTWLGAMSTARFVVIVLAVATLFTLYVGHVFATQDVLTEVQGLRNDQLALEMTFDKLEGEYHRVTGPERVFREARGLGLEDRLLEGAPVIVRR